ncbi:hypothetical protein DL98DRAFT_585477 [Cadophora sp. DSE1049]|nr:hypothetical protein DL98DRAFT_585477 [Cadophora sp. DSE1049]
MAADDGPPETGSERPPTVNELTLMLVVWFGVTIAVSFTAIRGWIRIKFDGCFKLDDILVVFALLLLIASAIMYTIILKPVYRLSRVASGISPAPTDAIGGAKFVSDTNFYMRVQFAITLAFWTCIWVVKSSFLAFFFPLSDGLVWARRFWHAVAAFCVGGYIACVVSYPVSCSEFTVGSCGTVRNIELSLVSLRMSTILDISTDVARTHPEVIWLALWSSIETSVAVVVVCLTSFKVFLRNGGKSSSGYRSQHYAEGPGFTRSRNIADMERRGSIPLGNVPASGALGKHRGEDVYIVTEGEIASNNSQEILVR